MCHRVAPLGRRLEPFALVATVLERGPGRTLAALEVGVRAFGDVDGPLAAVDVEKPPVALCVRAPVDAVPLPVKCFASGDRGWLRPYVAPAASLLSRESLRYGCRPEPGQLVHCRTVASGAHATAGEAIGLCWCFAEIGSSVSVRSHSTSKSFSERTSATVPATPLRTSVVPPPYMPASRSRKSRCATTRSPFFVAIFRPAS